MLGLVSRTVVRCLLPGIARGLTVVDCGSQVVRVVMTTPTGLAWTTIVTATVAVTGLALCVDATHTATPNEHSFHSQASWKLPV